MKNVLLLGYDGYIGWALLQKLVKNGYNIVAVDDSSRRNHVKFEMESFSATPILNFYQRIDQFEDVVFYKSNFESVINDITNIKFDTVINLAHQPSGPFSQISKSTGEYTLENNYINTYRILNWIKRKQPNAHYITIGSTGEYDHNLDIPIEEGYFTLPNASKESIFPRRTNSIYHCCYDKETEVLTDNGWKYFKDLLDSDKVATLNKEKDELEYQLPLNKFEYDFNGELISIKNRSCDLLVTPNHNVFEFSDHNTDLKKWRLTKAEDIYGKTRCFRKNVGNWNGKYIDKWVIPAIDVDMGNNKIRKDEKMEIDINEWIKFFSWFITEGCIYKNRVIICQKKEYNFEEIKDCLSHFDRRIQITKNKEGVIREFFISSVQLAEHLKQFGLSHQKFIPKVMKNLPKEQLQFLLETMIKGDGTVNKNNKPSWNYYSKSKRLIDDLQEVCLKCGYSTTITTQKRQKDEYALSITSNKTTQLIQSKSVNENRLNDTYSRVNYNDKVYCCEVPNSIIYVRRNGKSVWCGNSKIANTYLIDTLSRMWKIKSTDIQQAVVFGAYTDEIDKSKNYTRFDSDAAFGTVVNKFCVQAVLDQPLTIYGHGDHKRGFICLNDSIQALLIAIENDQKEDFHNDHRPRVWNQLSFWLSINELAEKIKNIGKGFGLNVKTEYVGNPRQENTNKPKHYSYKTNILESYGYEPTRSIDQEIKYVIKTLLENKDNIMPLKENSKSYINFN